MKKLSMPIEHFTDLEKITEIYNDLMTRLDTVVLVRQDDDMLVLSDYKLNCMWLMSLDEKQNIIKIAKF